MAKGTVIGVIIALIAGAAIGVYVSNTYLSQAGTTYFPLDIFPNEEGRIINQNFTTLQTLAVITDDDVQYVDMPDTSVSITTSGSSYLRISFIAHSILHVVAAHSGAVRFNITLVLNDVNYLITAKAFYYRGAAGTYILEISDSISMEYITDTLAAGTHTIKVIWGSMFAATGNNQLIVCSPNGNYSRTLLVQEIHT